jgi:DNA-binding transcriptional regulator YbjK
MSNFQHSCCVSQLPDADMQAAPVALARAALRAREIAIQTGTPLVVVREGKLIEAVVLPEVKKTMGDLTIQHKIGLQANRYGHLQPVGCAACCARGCSE